MFKCRRSVRRWTQKASNPRTHFLSAQLDMKASTKKKASRTFFTHFQLILQQTQRAEHMHDLYPSRYMDQSMRTWREFTSCNGGFYLRVLKLKKGLLSIHVDDTDFTLEKVSSILTKFIGKFVCAAKVSFTNVSIERDLAFTIISRSTEWT